MTDTFTEYFGQRLSDIREALELKQANIGDALGCSNGAYSLYERNKRQPPLSVLHNLCSKFGVSIDYLLGCFAPSPDLFADRLKEVISKRPGKSLKDFTETFDLDAATEKLLVSGVCFPSAKTLKNLCSYLSCSADFLIGLSDSMEPPIGIPVHIAPVSIPLSDPDPLDLLDDDLRSKAEGYIDSLLEQQKERSQKLKGQEA